MAFISLFVLLAFIFSSSPVSSKPISLCEALKSSCQCRLISEAEIFTVGYRQCLLERVGQDNAEIWNSMPIGIEKCLGQLWRGNYSQCQSEHLGNGTVEIWNTMQMAIEKCLGRDEFSKYLNIEQIGGPEPRELMKPVILPPSIDSSCTIVLVRGDPLRHGKSAEKQLIHRFPQCDLHTVGMERDESNPSGKFYDFQIFGRDGPNDEIGLRTDPIPKKMVDGNYGPYLAKMTSLLEKIIKVPQVDYLWIETVSTLVGRLMTLMKNDEEKIYIQPHLLNYPAHLILQESINVTVCQVDLITELFDYSRGYDMMLLARPLFPPLIKSIISNSSFLPFHSHYDNESYSLHTFYFNISDPYCLKKYLAPIFCTEFGCQENFDLVIDTNVKVIYP